MVVVGGGNVAMDAARTAVQGEADRMLAEVDPLVEGGNYVQAINRLKDLNKALAGLETGNTSLYDVLEHINFTRKVGQSKIPDIKLRSLINHFSLHRLRNEDFEFPDLLGAAYEYLIGEFADSAGKKGGEFYTPRSVVRVLVEMLEPYEGAFGERHGRGIQFIDAEALTEAAVALDARGFQLHQHALGDRRDPPAECLATGKRAVQVVTRRGSRRAQLSCARVVRASRPPPGGGCSEPAPDPPQ